MNVKQKLTSTKNKVAENQTKILTYSLVVATTTAVLMIRAKVLADNFLKEKGLYDEFYALEDDI